MTRGGEDKEGGVSVTHQWFGAMFAPFCSVSVSAGRAINIYNRDHNEDFHLLDVHNVVINTKMKSLTCSLIWSQREPECCLIIVEKFEFLNIPSCRCSMLRRVPLKQLSVSSDRSFLDAAPLPRWPQAERRKGSTCPSTWVLLWGWRLEYLYLVEFQVRDAMNKVSKDGLWFYLYSIFKPNISQETVSTENAW